MPSYKERRKRLDKLYAQLPRYTDTPEDKEKSVRISKLIREMLELPKWWNATLFPQDREELDVKKNTLFTLESNFKAPSTPYIKVIVKWSNRRHTGPCCNPGRIFPIQRHILVTALPLTQPDGSPWDFEKRDEFIPLWQECGDYCGCCGLTDRIELLHWKTIIPPSLT